MVGESAAAARSSRARLLAVTAVAISVAACGARGPMAVSPGVPGAQKKAASAVREPVPTELPLEPDETLESFMAKVRYLSTQARPEKPTSPTLEGTDAELKSALAAVLGAPSPATYRALAAAYKRQTVADKAYNALSRALELDSRDARTHDALARLWRDAGLPHLALGDAYRAVHFSRGSAETRNTLGTVFQALGRTREALTEYQRVVEREPLAAYGWNNLCYGWVVGGRPAEATRACQRALSLQPTMVAAQNNLGLARAQAGDMPGAERAFQLAGQAAQADFNLGVVQAATGQFALAARSFERAGTARPGWRDAFLLEGQAKRAAYQAQSGGRQ